MNTYIISYLKMLYLFDTLLRLQIICRFSCSWLFTLRPSNTVFPETGLKIKQKS